MIRREGRLDHPPRERDSDDRVPHPDGARRTTVVHNWEGALGIAALIGLLMFGAIAGVQGLLSLFPS